MNQTPKYHYAVISNSGYGAEFHEAGKNIVNLKLEISKGMGGILMEVKRKEDEGWELINIQTVKDTFQYTYYYFRKPR